MMKHVLLSVFAFALSIVCCAQQPLRIRQMAVPYAPLVANAGAFGAVLDSLQSMGVNAVSFSPDACVAYTVDSLHVQSESKARKSVAKGVDSCIDALRQRNMYAVIMLDSLQGDTAVSPIADELMHRRELTDTTVLSWQLTLPALTSVAGSRMARFTALAANVQNCVGQERLSICYTPATRDEQEETRIFGRVVEMPCAYLTLTLSPTEAGWTSLGALYDGLARSYVATDAILESHLRMAQQNQQRLLLAPRYPRDGGFRYEQTSTGARNQYLSYVITSVADLPYASTACGISFGDWGFSDMGIATPFSIYASDAETVGIIRAAMKNQ